MTNEVAWWRANYTDADCLDYLTWVRWPQGFVCDGCGSLGGWQLRDRRWKCPDCGARTSPTAGTIFDKTRTPLTVWFHAAWMFATQKDGISALALQRNLDIGSYQTAWAMLARFRSVLVRPGRDRLSGTVEVDESLFGGSAEGDKGGRTPGEKALVAIAVEHNDTTRLGRARMKVIPNAKAVTLKKFLKDSVEPGSTVSTDGWPSYPGATKGVYTHKSQVIPPKQASALLPGPHRVASLAKRWILSTHQGSFRDTHLQLYLDEFVFRFNRRNSRSRGMLFYRLMELAVAHDPVSYEALLTDEADRQKARKKRKRPNPPVSRGRPPTLEQSIDNRPWRA